MGMHHSCSLIHCEVGLWNKGYTACMYRETPSKGTGEIAQKPENCPTAVRRSFQIMFVDPSWKAVWDSRLLLRGGLFRDVKFYIVLNNYLGTTHNGVLVSWSQSALVRVNLYGLIGIWTKCGSLSVRPLATSFCEILIKIQLMHYGKKHVHPYGVRYLGQDLSVQWPCCLLCTKPSCKQLTYYQLQPEKSISMKLYIRFKCYRSRRSIRVKTYDISTRNIIYRIVRRDLSNCCTAYKWNRYWNWFTCYNNKVTTL